MPAHSSFLPRFRGDSHGSFTAIPLSAVPRNHSSSLPNGPIFGGPLTAEPEGITTDWQSDTTSVVSGETKTVLAPTPVSYIFGLRYTRRETLDYGKIAKHEDIDAENSLPLRKLDPTSKWESLVHPEGSVYFRQDNFFTNVWLYDSESLARINTSMQLVADMLRQRPHIPLKDIEVGLDLEKDEDNKMLACYYICRKSTKEVFWLHSTNNAFFTMATMSRSWEGSIFVGARGRDRLLVIAVQVSRDHVYMFPHGRHLETKELRGLKGDLAYYLFDKQTSPSSTAPYSTSDLDELLEILREVEVSADGEDTLPQYVVIVSRLMTTLCRERFIRFWGERYAQLDSDRSVYEEANSQRSFLFNFLAWLFFFTPPIYFERLSRIWVDGKINYDHWRNFISELQQDWSASITPSTVILSTNVGFLAIQSVDHSDTYRSMGQIVSYVSTLLALGNIIACTILARQHRPSTHFYASDAVKYLSPRASNRRGMESLAIIFSIPTAFFLWALLFFFIALSWVCFNNTTTVTRVVIAITTAVSGMLVAAIVHNGDWEPEQHTDSLSASMSRMHKLIKAAQRITRSWSEFTLVSSWRKSSKSLSPPSSIRSSRSEVSLTTSESCTTFGHR